MCTLGNLGKIIFKNYQELKFCLLKITYSGPYILSGNNIAFAHIIFGNSKQLAKEHPVLGQKTCYMHL